MKITKQKIEDMKKDIYDFCKRYGINKYEFSIFFNGKKSSNVSKNWRKCRLGITENVDPHDYCEYFNEQFILGMAYDGAMYEIMNGYDDSGLYDKFTQIFEKYDCYIEHCDSCHAEVVYNGDYEDVEYTVYKKKIIKNLYRKDDAPDSKIMMIMDTWMELSRREGDVGACVIGAYMEFEYEGTTYRMHPQSPYQGSLSWEASVDKIKEMLRTVGAENIYFNYGRLD